jgi:uncharacterized membrane protein
MGFVAPHSLIGGRIAVTARLLLGFVLVLAGTAHLTLARDGFLAQLPTWLPFEPDVTVVLSGIFEISLGLIFIAAVKYQRQVGFAAALFFMLVFPGAVANYIEHAGVNGFASEFARGIRLILDPLLAVWALWCTRALSLFR